MLIPSCIFEKSSLHFFRYSPSYQVNNPLKEFKNSVLLAFYNFDKNHQSEPNTIFPQQG